MQKIRDLPEKTLFYKRLQLQKNVNAYRKNVNTNTTTGKNCYLSD